MKILGPLALAITLRCATPVSADAARSRRVVVTAGDRSLTSVERYSARRILIDEVDAYPAGYLQGGGTC